MGAIGLRCGRFGRGAAQRYGRDRHPGLGGALERRPGDRRSDRHVRRWSFDRSGARCTSGDIGHGQGHAETHARQNCPTQRARIHARREIGKQCFRVPFGEGVTPPDFDVHRAD